MYTIFETPGVFDLRSVSTFGFNSKPNSLNPIGRFGTGLKYAIAILLREGATIDLYCNGDHYSFYLKDETFRDKVFRKVWYKKRNTFLGLYADHELPYTTEYGKDWQLWQAFRELYANTLDEDGTVWVPDDAEDVDYFLKGREGFTRIVIKHQEFSLLVNRKDEIFLPQQRELVVDRPGGNIAEGKSDHLYFRGMRALDLPEDTKAMFTYNVIEDLELTEDRTIKSTYVVRREVANMISKAQNKEVIKAILTAPEKTFEKDLDFQYAYGASEEFKEVLISLRDHRSLNRSARVYYDSYISPPKSPKVTDAVWALVLECLEDAQQEIEKHSEIFHGQISINVEGIANTYLETFRKRMER